MEQITIKTKERTENIEFPDELGFGNIFTDHIFEMNYTQDKGWYDPTIKPLEDIPMHPGTMFIHYGQSIFEGLKAYKTKDDEVVLFRPDEHFKRLNRSAQRICIPEINVDFMINALKELVNIERDWVPTGEGESLYVRPFIYGSDPFLGVNPASSYKLIILLSPVGAYYPEGFKPVKILVQDEYVRAVRKGLGECKTPANYAASLLAGKKAMEQGFTQVLWLDGVELKNIEEVGTMNIFINMKDEIVTPKLNGSILPGVTRKTVIQLLKEWDMNIVERDISIDELMKKYDSGDLLGVFGSGTAAVISSVGWLTYKDKKMVINNGKAGELALKLFNEITSIQYGIKDDSHEWIYKVEKNEVEVS
jgi:branched-chain amino acid aminotransferase